MSKKKERYDVVHVSSGVKKWVDKKTGATVAFYGYTHRGGCPFKIGDKLFDENWTDRGRLSTADVENLPFISRGGRTIRTWKEAEEAARNLSKYLS